jgi:triacylglycerol esterase/lipase EstA (alpha/beta hydrolase family)
MKTTMIQILFSFLIYSSASLSSAQTQHVVLVHGVGGNEKTFGAMGEALKYRAEKRGQNLKHYKFVYDTAKPELDSDDFAIQLGRYLKKEVFPQLQSEEDRISFVCHSQGGLVTSIWYFHSFMQHKGLRQDHRYTGPDARMNTSYSPEIIPYVDSIVTLGTPFWGSRLATFLIEDGIKNSAARTLSQGFMEAMGQKQLQEMALGSRTVMNFRKNISSMPYTILKEITQNLRALNIAGVANMLKSRKLF